VNSQGTEVGSATCRGDMLGVQVGGLVGSFLGTFELIRLEGGWSRRRSRLWLSLVFCSICVWPTVQGVGSPSVNLVGFMMYGQASLFASVTRMETWKGLRVICVDALVGTASYWVGKSMVKKQELALGLAWIVCWVAGGYLGVDLGGTNLIGWGGEWSSKPKVGLVLG